MTLEGEKSDWEEIHRRLYRLYELGEETAMWADMLRPILRRFIDAFDGAPDVKFWQHVVHRTTVSCGEPAISGWLVAFCLWSHEGTWLPWDRPSVVPTRPLVIPPPVVRPRWKEPEDDSNKNSLARARRRLSQALPNLFRKVGQRRVTQEPPANDKGATVASAPKPEDSETTSAVQVEDKPQLKKSVVERGECRPCTFENPLTG